LSKKALHFSSIRTESADVIKRRFLKQSKVSVFALVTALSLLHILA